MRLTRKRKELLIYALNCAVSDRLSYADAYKEASRGYSEDPPDENEKIIKEALNDAKQFQLLANEIKKDLRTSNHD